MVKKTLLSLAIAASTAGLTACNISSTADNNEVTTNPVTAGTAGNLGLTTPVFSAANKTLPLINDLLFANASVTDGTASAGDSQPPVTTALNSIEGASLVAPIDIEFTADLDAASIQHPLAVRLIKLRNAEDDAGIDALDLVGSILPAVARNAAWGRSPIDSHDDQPVWGTDYTVSFLALDNGATPVLRINIINPLDPKTKYIVALTNKISDSKGNTVARSSEYNLLSGDLELPSAALVPVRGAVQGWEEIAGGHLAFASQGTVTQDDIVLSYAFTTGGTSEVLTSIAAPQLFVEALASKPETAEKLVFAATLGGALAQMGVTAANATPEQLGQANAAAVSAISNIITAVATADSFADAANRTDAEIAEVKKTDAYKNTIIAQASSPQVIAGITATLATPSAQDFDLILAAANTPVAITATQAGTLKSPVPIGLSDTVKFVQGQIKLPVGFSAPAMTNAEKLQDALLKDEKEEIANLVKLSFATDSVWSAAKGLNPPSDDKKFNPFTGKLTDGKIVNPQTEVVVDAGVKEVKDDAGNVTGYTGGMTNVTYRYPLVELDQTEYAPVLMTVPSKTDYTAIGGQNCSAITKFPTMIYVHGITSDRTSSIGVGTAMAINCYVTVAMDLPLHGVAPIANDRNGTPGVNSLTFNIDQTAATSPFGTAAINATNNPDISADFEERHRNIAAQPVSNARIAMDFDGSTVAELAGTSGSQFINLGNMGRTRDNLRQAVVDLMHLNATIGSIDVDGDGDADLDTSKVYLSGNSLGAIVAGTFAAVNNQAAVQAKNPALNKIQGVVLASPGASLPKMLENSPGFSTKILGGLNLAQDASSLQKYESMLQATLNSIDAINFAELLRNDDTPVMMYNMVGGGDCPNFDLATGTCSDNGDRIPAPFIQAFATSNTTGVYPPDHVVPNDDYFKAAETNAYVNVMLGLTFDLKDKDGMPTEVAMRNLDSSKMPLAGTTPLAEQMGLTQVNSANISTVTVDKKVYIPFEKGSHVTFVASDDTAVFKTMMTQMGTFFATGGTALNPTPALIDGIAPEQTGYTPVAGE